MSERVGPGPISSAHCLKEAVCIHTDKVYDACKEKDCLEDLRVILTREGQEIVNCAINVKVRKAEVIWVYTDIEPVPFNRGYFTVDIKYFFNVTLEVFRGVGRPVEVNGLATFDKKVILFGSEGNSKVFTSKYAPTGALPPTWKKSNLPKAVVEVVDPIALSARLTERRECDCHFECDLANVPESVHSVFDCDLTLGNEEKRVFVSLGLFTIVKIERNVQLLIPCYDFCVPNKECVTATEENPCDLFSKIRFPIDEFFPPLANDFPALENTNNGSSDERLGEFMERNRGQHGNGRHGERK